MLATGAHSSATVRKVGQILSKVMRWAAAAGLIGRSPCAGLRLPAESAREMRFVTAAQVAKLAEAVGPDYSTLVYTAAFARRIWAPATKASGLRPHPYQGQRRVSVSDRQCP